MLRRDLSAPLNHRRIGAQSTLGGHNIFARKMCMKINKMSEFLLYLPEKLTKFPNFKWFLPEKCPNFTQKLPEKNVSRILGEGGWACAPPPYPRLLRLWSMDSIQLVEDWTMYSSSDQNFILELRADVTRHTGSHSGLATRHKWTRSALTPVRRPVLD